MVDPTALDEGAWEGDVYYTDDDGIDIGGGSVGHDSGEVLPASI